MDYSKLIVKAIQNNEVVNLLRGDVGYEVHALEILISGGASDVYIALLYFDTCIFQEEINRATFLIEKEEIAKKLKKSINSNKEELKDCVEFANGLVKLNPWTNIERFNTYYVKRYGINIL